MNNSFFHLQANEIESSTSPPVSELIGFRRRHRSAMSPAAITQSGELPWHGIESRSPSEDIQAKLRSRHKSSIDDRRLTIDMDDTSRDPQGNLGNSTLPGSLNIT